MRQKCVNRFCDIYVPKERKLLSRHTCQSAKTLLTKVQNMDVATILQTIKILAGKFPDCLESFQTFWKASRQSGNFLHCLETFHTVKKISRISGIFRTNWKVSRPSGDFPDCLETFRTGWKLSRLSRNFPDCPETFQTGWKLSTFVYSSVQLMLRLHFMSNFVDMRKNFPDAQQLSGRRCRRADEVFGTLEYNLS